MELRLNLNPDFINRYWKSADIIFHDLLNDATKLETWTLTNEPSFQAKLKELTSSCVNFPTKHFVDNDNQVVEMMSYMNISQFAYFFHYLDNTYPGLSFHYIMETKHKENWLAGELLLKRITLIDQWGHLNKICSPVRTRLIHSILEADDY